MGWIVALNLFTCAVSILVIIKIGILESRIDDLIYSQEPVDSKEPEHG